MRDATVEVSNGLATLGEGPLRALRRLDDVLLSRARACGATEIAFPPLSPVASLDRIDYFVNFPHLGVAASPLRPEVLSRMASGEERPQGPLLASTLMDDVRYLLPSAACYPIYARLEDTVLTGAQRVTTRQLCFRNEAAYGGLERLFAFTMRELSR